MGSLYNLARVRTTTTGTGTITLGAAVPGFLTFASAGVHDGEIVGYGIRDGVNSEVGNGTYTSSGTTLTRTVTTSTNGNAAINLSGNAQVYISAAAEDLRERLFANRDYYIRSDGSNSNSGLANTAGSAWLTLQHAYDEVSSALDFSGFTVTVNLQASTTFTSGVTMSAPWHGGGSLVIQGLGSTVINVTGGGCVNNTTVISGILAFKDLKLQTTTSGDAVTNGGVGTLSFNTGIDFGACAGAHIVASGVSARVNFNNDYTISGGAAFAHWSALFGGFIYCPFRTVTLTGTPVLTLFAEATGGAYMQVYLMTFTGGASAGTKRYSAISNAVIDTGGGGATYLPGGVAGTTATQGQYL